MVRIVNFTPFANLRFSNRNAVGKEFGVFMAKTAMDIRPDGSCKLSSEQEPFALTDIYHGELNVSSLRYPSDFVPFKPTSEIILDATAYAPGFKSASEWKVSVRVSDENGPFCDTELIVTGPRQWEPVWLKELNEAQKMEWEKHRAMFAGWKLSPPEEIDRLPVRYEYAFGGMTIKGTNDDGQPFLEADERNPVGSGLIDREFTDHSKSLKAPQLLAPGAILSDPYGLHPIAGLGPIPPAWLPRRSMGGTYDEHWLKNVWPNWAGDYDYRFHNSAPAALQGNRYLEGEILIELRNLHHEHSDFTIQIPAQKMFAIAVKTDGSEQNLKMSLDTVFLEISENSKGDPRVYCIWRTPFDLAMTEGLVLLYANDSATGNVDGDRIHPDSVACDPALLDHKSEEEAA